MKQKNKVDRHFNKPRRLLLSLSILTVLLFMISSCNNEKKAEPENDKEKEKEVAALTAASRWPVFKLDAPTIMSCADLLGPGNASVILKHQLTGIENDGRAVMNLIGISSQNHGLHGRNKNICFTTTPDSYNQLNGTVILGNNYLNWRVIGDAIFTNAAKTTLRPNFGYILLEPMNTYEPGQHPARPMVAGHLWYRLTYYDTEGNPWDPQPGGGGGSGSSNPSPPADPTP